MIKVDLAFINNELKLNMDRLRIIRQNNSVSIEERNKIVETGNQVSILNSHVYYIQHSDGFVIKEKHGVIIKQAEPYSFYRGENQLFSSCKSSFFRKYSGDITIDKLISDMKIELFARVISELDLIKKWDYCNVFPEFIAQHYGLDTEYLDVTGNFLVAMFFAVSRYDKELCKYVPITDDYIEEHPEHKYGYFYKRKNPDRLLYSFDKVIKVGDIIPIGFQPFMRCSAQFGYMIKCDDNYDLAKDTDYEKYCFNQSSALSKYIYSKCKEGKAIMPYEGLTKLLPVVEIIKNTSTFDNICFDNALNANNVKEQKEDILKKLKSKNISIVDAINIGSIVSEEQIELIDKDYKDFDFKEYYGVEYWTIPVIKPNATEGANMKVIVKPNISFDDAINIAFKNAKIDTSMSKQFVSNEPFVLRKGNKEITVAMNKIRVAFSNNRWNITEYNVVPKGELVPVKLVGNYELLSEFECDVY